MQQNPRLADLSALGALRNVGGGFQIRRAPRLASLAGLDALETVGGDVVVEVNDGLETLGGLDALASVGGALSVRGNPALSTLRALGRVSSVGRATIIGENPALVSLDGLEWIRETRSLRVLGNAALTSCACGLRGLISDGAFTGVASELEISGNAPGGACTSPAAVLADTCPFTSAPLPPTLALALRVVPNPAASGAHARYAVPTAGPATVAVFDALGRRVAVLADGPHAAGDHAVPLPALAPGGYVVRVGTAGGTAAARLTVAR